MAVGRPAKVICTVDDFYERRKTECINEAFEYVNNSIIERYDREPYYEEFYEEFHLFVDKSNIHKYPKLPIFNQLGAGYVNWLKNHKAMFTDFEMFVEEAKRHKVH